MYASARRFFARLASEIFLSSLRTEFFSELLVALQSEMGLELLAFGIGETNIGKHVAVPFFERHASSFFSRHCCCTARPSQRAPVGTVGRKIV